MIDHHRPSMIWELYMQRLQDSQTVSHHRRRFWTPSKWYQTYWNTLTNLHLWKPFSIQGRLWETCRRSISVQICRAWSLHHGFEYLWIRAPYIILTVSDHSPALDWPDSHGWRNSGKFWSATSLSLCSLMHFYAFFLSRIRVLRLPVASHLFTLPPSYFLAWRSQMQCALHLLACRVVVLKDAWSFSTEPLASLGRSDSAWLLRPRLCNMLTVMSRNVKHYQRTTINNLQ